MDTQACERYEAACSLREGSHAAQYNWGVALSDLARHHRARGDLAEAEAHLIQSAQMYAASLKWNPNNPQVAHFLQEDRTAKHFSAPLPSPASPCPHPLLPPLATLPPP